MTLPSNSEAKRQPFQTLQYQLTQHIRDPKGHDVPQGMEARRVKIYRELFYNNVEGFLSSSFPVLRELYSDEAWHAMVRDYFSRHVSHTPLFPEMPREFLKYLEQEREPQGDDFPFLLELAHYEWVELALYMIDSDNITTVDSEGDLLQGVPVISPLAWLLSYRYPVHKISPEFIPSEPEETPSYLMVYRDQEDEVRFIELNPITMQLMSLLKTEASLTGIEALNKMIEELQHPNPQVLIDGGRQILQQMHEKGIILGIKK